MSVSVAERELAQSKMICDMGDEAGLSDICQLLSKNCFKKCDNIPNIQGKKFSRSELKWYLRK